MRFYLLFFLGVISIFSTARAEVEYCMAVRGNGELMPAHWGAVSGLVERLGLPKAQAGGSSGSVTTFFIDAIASHPLVKGVSGEERSRRAALMIKSLEGFSDYLMMTDEFGDFVALYRKHEALISQGWLDGLHEILNQTDRMGTEQLTDYLRSNAELIRRSLNTGLEIGLFGRDNYEPLFTALRYLASGRVTTETIRQLGIARFYLGELGKAVRVFGAFDANDGGMFFRPGLVNFDRFARQIGRIGEFYSGQSATPSELQYWQDWFDRCAAATHGRLWNDVKADRAECVADFQKLITSHLSHQEASRFVMGPVGQTILSFPTTSVLVGKSYEEARDGLLDYQKALDPQFGRHLTLSDPGSVKFGYWGNPQILNRIKARLPVNDEKSERFMGLGAGPWYEALRLSPAEPGLSNFRPFEAEGRQLISAGGWSDLHPVAVLKAAGCENVVYVTRRGPESPFAKGVARRLLGESDQDRLFNLDEPDSSFRRALSTADAVLCTDWNHFTLKDGLREMIKEAYASPYVVKFSSSLREYLRPVVRLEEVNAEYYKGCL
jgi:hypothetical protein